MKLELQKPKNISNLFEDVTCWYFETNAWAIFKWKHN